MRRESVTSAESFMEAMDLVVGLGPDHAGLSTGALVAYRHRIRDVARKGIAAEVAVSSGAAANHRSLEKALERVLGSEASGAAQRLTAGAAGSDLAGFISLECLWLCHTDVSHEEELQKAVYDGPLEETEDRLRALGPPGDAFLAEVERRLRYAGSRSLYGGETWAERLVEVWANLRRVRSTSPERGPETWVADARNQAAQFMADLEARISTARRPARILTGQVVDVRRRLVRRIVADTRLFLRYREMVKGATLRLGGEERRVVLELARRLVDAGHLDRDADVELLSDGELDDLALGRNGPGARDLSRRRAAARTAEEATPPPEAFQGEPTIDPPDLHEGDGQARTLRGWAASPGRVTGRARIVRQLADSRDLVRGEILVGHATDPSWTPLFATAGGVVMERGGPLSHAAIIAREFGLPAVLNVAGATRMLATGTPVMVDGTTGTVEILEGAMEDQS
jgi:pyruvate,water dikinase